MGRQLCFWMTQSDEHAFLERLRQDDAVWTPRVLEYGNTPAIQELDDWSPIDDGQRLIVVQRTDWNLLEWNDISKPPSSDESDHKEWTRVGTGASPSIEWDTCRRGADYILRGRIFFRTDWLEGDQVLVKPEAPTRWFDRLASWLRRRGRKWEYARQYVMPDAARAMDDGIIHIEYP